MGGNDDFKVLGECIIEEDSKVQCILWNNYTAEGMEYG